MSMMKGKRLRFVAITASGMLCAQAQGTPAPVIRVTPSGGAVPTTFSPSVAEVVKLAQSGVGDDVVIAYIKTSQVPYNLSANDIVALKNTGLSQPLITGMLNQDNALRNQSHPPGYPQQPPAPAEPAPVIPNAPTAPAAASVPPAPTTVPSSGVLATNADLVAAQPSRPVEQAPPPSQPEVVPVTPGPNYYWVPGYWSWNGTWIWVPGRWAVRPWHGAVWVGGHWARHGRGYIWIGGGWH